MWSSVLFGDGLQTALKNRGFARWFSSAAFALSEGAAALALWRLFLLEAASAQPDDGGIREAEEEEERDEEEKNESRRKNGDVMRRLPLALPEAPLVAFRSSLEKLTAGALSATLSSSTSLEALVDASAALTEALAKLRGTRRSLPLASGKVETLEEDAEFLLLPSVAAIAFRARTASLRGVCASAASLVQLQNEEAKEASEPSAAMYQWKSLHDAAVALLKALPGARDFGLTAATGVSSAETGDDAVGERLWLDSTIAESSLAERVKTLSKVRSKSAVSRGLSLVVAKALRPGVCEENP